jgi:hypothetical protein
MIDGGLANLEHVSLSSDSVTGEFHYETEVSLNNTSSATPDQVWTQCNIQFRVKSYTEVRQSQGFENQLTTTAEACDQDGMCRIGDKSRITRAMQPFLTQQDAMHIALGGDMGDDCDGEGKIFGVTCGPGCSGNIKNDHYMAVLLDGNTPSTLAHEFGHFLGLPHTNDVANCGLDREGRPNIMDQAGQSIPWAAGLTRDQCSVARCVAEKWLIKWGRAEAGSDVDCQ